MTMLFVATSSYLWFGAGIAGGSLAAVAAYYLFPHVRRRVEAWADPWSDIANKGYQVAQALFAIGTGGWFGMGLYRGMPEKIPVVDKDFVFAAISEEMGALYALCVLFLCLGCYMQFMLIAMKMQAMFYKLIAFGLGSVYIIPGISDHRRGDEVYPVHRCDAAPCELRRQLHRLDLYHIPGHPGTLCLKTRGRRGGGEFQ